MKNGVYKIVHRDHGNIQLPGEELGSFIVMNNKISNRDGIAEQLLKDGPIDSRIEVQITRLNNGYNWVEWERLPHTPDNDRKLHAIASRLMHRSDTE